MLLKRHTFVCVTLIFLLSCHKQSDQATKSLLYTLSDSLGSQTISNKEKIVIAVKADSLAIVTSNDSMHLHLLMQTADLYLTIGDMANAKNGFTKAADIARRKGQLKNLAISLNNLGVIFDETSEMDSALRYYGAAANIFYRINDSLHYAEALINVGIILKNKGAYDTSVKVSITAAKVLEALRSFPSLSNAYTTIGNSFKALNRLDQALDYHREALTIRQSERDLIGIAGSLNNIGNVYRYKKDYAKALHNYSQSLAIKRQIGTPKSTAITLDNVAEVYLEKKEYYKAKSYFIEALNLRRSSNDNDGFLTTANRLVALLLELNDIKGAEMLAAEATEVLSQVNYNKQRLDNAITLYSIYAKSGKYKEATKYALLSLKMKDSMFNSEMGHAVSEMEVKYRTSLKDAEIAQQNAELRLQKTKNNMLVKGISLVALFLCTVSAFYVRIRRQKNTIGKQKQEIVHNNRNSIQQLMSILNRQIEGEGHDGNASANQERLFTLSLLNRLLYESEGTKAINWRVYIEELVSAKQTSYDITILLNIENISLYLETNLLKNLGLIINELTTNAGKHAGLDNNKFLIINLEIKEAVDELIIFCRDNGTGFPETKTKLHSFGLSFVKDIVQQYKGSVQMFNDNGACVKIILKK
jgi:two-component system, sensor histidine kinase PdtaS